MSLKFSITVNGVTITTHHPETISCRANECNFLTYSFTPKATFMHPGLSSSKLASRWLSSANSARSDSVYRTCRPSSVFPTLIPSATDRIQVSSFDFPSDSRQFPPYSCAVPLFTSQPPAAMATARERWFQFIDPASAAVGSVENDKREPPQNSISNERFGSVALTGAK